MALGPLTKRHLTRILDLTRKLVVKPREGITCPVCIKYPEGQKLDKFPECENMQLLTSEYGIISRLVPQK